jgi:peptidoglycan/xylan/chitin deacetylase (PgdA/CDA1 family)
MSLRSVVGRAWHGVLRSRHRRQVPINGSGPLVSFSFDDFPRTAFTAGGSILGGFGVRGTYYVAAGLMGTSNESGDQFLLEDLHRLLQDGHELAGHTFSHSSSRRVALSEFQQDVRKGQQALREIVNSHASDNFAYPFGEVTLEAKRAIGTEMTSCRGVYPGLNGPDVDLNLLNANLLYGDVDNLKEVEQLVRENERQKGWLIFYTHDVRRNPSEYGCTPELLEAACRLACEHSKALPVGEVIRAFKGRTLAATA